MRWSLLYRIKAIVNRKKKKELTQIIKKIYILNYLSYDTDIVSET